MTNDRRNSASERRAPEARTGRRGAGGLSSDEPSAPKTTRPEAIRRREPEARHTAAQRMQRTLDAAPDRIDIRDWFYQPRLVYLPDQIVNCDFVPAILDQGREGACTGFALAAAINFLLAGRNIRRSVSARMLYEMARRYDEWPGEGYDGSSARGAMKGWVRHGVCSEVTWPMATTGFDFLQATLDPATGRTVGDEARETPGGAFYRVSHREVRDMHAALAEVGILYCTLMVHEGWDSPGQTSVTVNYVVSGNLRQRTLPVIRRTGRADSGHAIAIVGYTAQGFIVQNSWGPDWGAGGFALLPYEDYMLHATDVWAVQLGVPVSIDLWAAGNADSTAGLQRASAAIPLNEIRAFVVDIGNNGELSDSGDYWTTKGDIGRLFAETIPKATENWDTRRIMLYLHGGLNDEAAVARRVVGFRDVLLENQVYPLHIMWESGAGESLRALVHDLFTDVDERAGGIGDWLRRTREGLIEAKDRTLELTAARPGGALWSEMKENARLASDHPDGKGGMQIIAEQAGAAFKAAGADPKRWELHVVAHSAGGIFAAHAMRLLTAAGLPFKTFQLMAPAIRIDEFEMLVLPLIGAKRCPLPTLYVLSDVGERDDDVGPYGKSLLYLVSNAFEGKRETPLLGMARFITERDNEEPWRVNAAMNDLFARTVDGLPSLVIAGAPGKASSRSRSDTHGGFDNDPDTMNSVLWRILGNQPRRQFTVRDLQYESAMAGVARDWLSPAAIRGNGLVLGRRA